MNHNKSGSVVRDVMAWAATGVGVYLVASALMKELSRFSVEGKVVLITGGSRGFGHDLASGQFRALRTKFEGNAARVLPAERIQPLYEAINGFESVRDAGIVSRMIAAGQLP